MTNDKIISNIKQHLEELWKDVKDYEGLYQVSNLGNVRSINNGQIQLKKLSKNSDGYLTTSLKGKRVLVHRLVAEAFIPNSNPQEKIFVNHINEKRDDNRASNLEWVTPHENNMHGTARKKISEKLSVPVVEYDIEGNIVREFNSVGEASIFYGISQERIKRITKEPILRYKFEKNEYNLEDKEGEIWEWISGYEGKYKISTYGRCKSYVSGKEFLLKPLQAGGSYYHYSLEGKKHKIHRLVAETFLPNPMNFPIIHHKDENKFNNHVDNLEWCDKRQNALYSSHYKKRAVLQYTTTGEFVKEYNSVGEVATLFKKNISPVINSATGYSRGYLWTYKDYDDIFTKVINYSASIQHKSNLRGIIQLDLNGNLIKEWRCGREIKRDLGYSRRDLEKIHKNCNKKSNQHKGFIWSYSDNYISQLEYNELTSIQRRRGKPLYKLDVNDKIVKQFDSVREAAQELNITTSRLYHYTSLYPEIINGYKWFLGYD